MTALPLLLIIFLIYHFINFLSTKHFEKSLQNEFGQFEKTIFIPSNNIDKQYYKHFKIELAKAFGLIAIILLCFGLGSPFKIAQKWIHQERYNDVIKLTTIGSKIFPIATKWYSLRAYSKFRLKDYQGAISDYDKAYKLGPDEYNVMNFDNKIYIKTKWYSLRAYSKFRLKDYQGAISDYDKAYKLGPDEYNVMNFDNKIYIKYLIKEYLNIL